jgi:hypothetical protein
MANPIRFNRLTQLIRREFSRAAFERRQQHTGKNRDDH